MGDVLFPRQCLVCERSIFTGGDELLFVHEDCLRELYAFDSLTGTIRGHLLGVGKRTDRASVAKTFYGEGRSLWEYRGLAKKIIREFKYHRAEYLEHDIQLLLHRNEHWRDFLRDAVLVPVPLHKRRLRERGFNQSERIARLFCHLDSSLEMQHLLERKLFTTPQVELERKNRLQNMADAFAFRKKNVLDKDRRYVLIDDVFTTGSTIDACARVLRRAGGKRIDFLTLAHG